VALTPVRFRVVGEGDEGVAYLWVREIEGGQFRLSHFDRHDKEHTVETFPDAESCMQAFVSGVVRLSLKRYAAHLSFIDWLRSQGTTTLKRNGFRSIRADALLIRCEGKWKAHTATWGPFYYSFMDSMFEQGWPKVPVPTLPWDQCEERKEV
jgi:hypothetical protein